eukprot:1155413-Pelagomonas_calceolata.AAC.4
MFWSWVIPVIITLGEDPIPNNFFLFYWFCAAVRFYNALPRSNSTVLLTTPNKYPLSKLADRPHNMLWLTKAYALPACIYARQIWGTRYMKPGVEMDCPLQTVHLCLLKCILGVKRTTPNRSVLRDCGFEPLHFNWFCSAVRLYNASLTCNSITLRKVLAADAGMSNASPKC